MEPEYLSELGLTPEEHTKVAGLGASSAAALWSMWQAAPTAMETLLGNRRSLDIHTRLRELLTPEEVERLDHAPEAKTYPLGASLRTPPSHLPPPAFDIEKRNRIFDELQKLRDSAQRSEGTETKILSLELELNELLEKRRQRHN